MRVFLTGSTGVIGRRAVPLLVSARHQVTAVARSAEKRLALERAGATAVTVDPFDPLAVRQAVRGHDAVINLATHIPRATRAFFPERGARTAACGASCRPISRLPRSRRAARR